MAGGGGGSVERIITDDMRASAEVSAAQWNDYQTRFAPFEQKFMDDVTRDQAGTLNKIQGQTNADLQQKVAASSGPQAGFDPSRGSTVSASAVAKGLSAGFTEAQKGVNDQQAQNLATVVGMGRGQAVDAVGTMSDLAASSGQAALTRSIADATESMNERGATMSLIGSGLGAAGAIGNNYMQTGSFFGAGTSQPKQLSGLANASVNQNGVVMDMDTGNQYMNTKRGLVPYR